VCVFRALKALYISKGRICSAQPMAEPPAPQARLFGRRIIGDNSRDSTSVSTSSSSTSVAAAYLSRINQRLRRGNLSGSTSVSSWSSGGTFLADNSLNADSASGAFNHSNSSGGSGVFGSDNIPTEDTICELEFWFSKCALVPHDRALAYARQMVVAKVATPRGLARATRRELTFLVDKIKTSREDAELITQALYQEGYLTFADGAINAVKQLFIRRNVVGSESESDVVPQLQLERLQSQAGKKKPGTGRRRHPYRRHRLHLRLVWQQQKRCENAVNDHQEEGNETPPLTPQSMF